MQVRLEDILRVAADFVNGISPQARAIVVGFRGDLGAGKTTFTKAIAAKLGVTDTITSPTFVIMKHYETKHSDFTHITHIDAYRLDKGTDLEPLKFDELLNDPHRLIIIEWPEKVADALPEYTHYIDFTVVDENTRDITGI